MLAITTRMAIIKQEMEGNEKARTFYKLMEINMAESHQKAGWQLLKSLNTELSHDTALFLPSIDPK